MAGDLAGSLASLVICDDSALLIMLFRLMTMMSFGVYDDLLEGALS